MVWITLPHEYDERQWVRYSSPLPMQNTAYNARCVLDFLCTLNVESHPHKTCRATNIACCVGNFASRDISTLEQMMEYGMNIARLNLTLHYGDLEYHAQTVQNIRQAARNYSKKLGVPFPIAIACNTIGPLVQTGYLEGGLYSEVELKVGNTVKVTTDPAYKEKGSNQVIYIDYESIFETIALGRTIWIDDGSIKLIVKSISGAFMTCHIEIGGKLGNKKTVHLPGTKVNLPAISEIDKDILQYAIANDFDFLFCTFVRNAETLLEIRNDLGEAGKHIKLIANIEDLQGLDNIDEIMKVADGIVVARGDLYLEVSIQKMFLAQKYLIAKCNKAGVPVFVSRELIESMMEKGVPTRADVGNITGVIIDGCDCVMLARETLQENYLGKIVKFVSHVCKESEVAVWGPHNLSAIPIDKDDFVNIIAMTAVESSVKLRAAAIIVITTTGITAQIVSKYRPRCPIVAVTRDARVARQLHLYRSVIPFQYLGPVKNTLGKDIDVQVAAAIFFGKKRKFIGPSDPVVIVHCGKTNTMRVHYVPEKLKVVNNVLCIS